MNTASIQLPIAAVIRVDAHTLGVEIDILWVIFMAVFFLVDDIQFDKLSLIWQWRRTICHVLLLHRTCFQIGKQSNSFEDQAFGKRFRKAGCNIPTSYGS